MIVLGQRMQSVKDLVKQVLGAQLLQDLTIDSRTHLSDPFLVDSGQDIIGGGSNRSQGFPLSPMVRLPRRAHGQNPPHAAAPPQAPQGQLGGNAVVAPANKGSQEFP